MHVGQKYIFDATDPKPSDTMHQLKKVFIYLQWASLSCVSINEDCCQNCRQYRGAIMPTLLALAALKIYDHICLCCFD